VSGRLTTSRFAEGVDALCAADADLAAVVDAFGAPPIWRRPAGFPTLALLILEQQVSLASAKAACDKLTAAAGGALDPAALLALDDDAMRGCGVSRQKTRYIRILAGAVADGALRLDRLARADDEAVRTALTAITGIGNWTADIYMMMALGRPDVWPVGDLALQVAAQAVKRLPERPAPDALVDLGEAWRPWRAVAARILWHYYLNTVRKRRGEQAT
jgi:DNA-3-methyladenine glycosylase II